MNKTISQGHLTRDPELKFTAKGTPVCSFGIAMNDTYTKDNGEKVENVTFVDVEAWNGTAESIAQWFGKGGVIIVEGKLKMDEWEDKTTGQKRSKLKIVCERFHFCGDAKGKSSGGEASNRQQQPPQQQRPTNSRPAQQQRQPEPEEDDSIPF